jgi:hypothetical protein
MKTKTILFCAVLLSASACQTLAASALTLDNPNLVGAAGTTVGWGFTITNDTNYLVATNSDYLTLNVYGVYTDFIFAYGIFQVVGPSPESATWSEPFDPVAHTGLGSFTINDFLPLGTLSNGHIQVTYDLYSVSPNDPNFDPTVDTLATGQKLSANASVLVATPEPATIGLFTAGVLVLFWRGRSGARLIAPALRAWCRPKA